MTKHKEFFFRSRFFVLRLKEEEETEVEKYPQLTRTFHAKFFAFSFLFFSSRLTTVPFLSLSRSIIIITTILYIYTYTPFYIT